MTYPATTDEHFYVAAEDRGRTALALGPYANHGDAAGNVERARLWALRNTSDTQWATWGVARVTGPHARPGRLNNRLGVEA